MSLLLWIILFIISLAVLVKSSDLFIDSSEKIGLFLGLPSFIVGVIIVAFGTSLPELVSSIIAVVEGSSEIVVGNALGSNITNIFLVLGITAVIGREFSINYNLMRVDLPFLLGSAILVALMLLDSVFSLTEALISLVCLSIYIFNSLRTKNGEDEQKPERPKALTWVLLAASPVFVYLGAKYTVRSVIQISTLLGIGSEVIALSAVALGTSLPEVVVSIAAARRGNPEMSVGNIIGSNIFNTFAVLGIPALIGPLAIPSNIRSFAIPVFLGATVLCILVTMERKVNRWSGSLFLIFYIFFIGKLFNFF
jgi:cation:H+ antiporter